MVYPQRRTQPFQNWEEAFSREKPKSPFRSLLERAILFWLHGKEWVVVNSAKTIEAKEALQTAQCLPGSDLIAAHFLDEMAPPSIYPSRSSPYLKCHSQNLFYVCATYSTCFVFLFTKITHYVTMYMSVMKC